MPYLTCSSCGLRSYAVSEGTCPSCGTGLRRGAPPAGPRTVASWHGARPPAELSPDAQVNATLAMACRELDADAALLSEIRRGHEHVRWGAGENGWVGAVVPLQDTVCEKLLDGRIGSVVADATLEPSLAGLESVVGGIVRSYLGVPFETETARAYVLCCLSREARPDLGESDVRFLQGIAESLRPLLEPS
jgi:GAF domain-containing protein